jgi:spermidine/putrescine transport system permease protein
VTASATAEVRARRADVRRGLGLVGPALAWTGAFFALPIAVSAAWSLFVYAGRTLDTTPTLANYERFFTTPGFVAALFSSLEIAAIVTVVSVLLAYPLAWMIAFRVPKQWQRLALVLAILPFWTSYIVRSYAWLLVLAPNGVVNQALLAAGLIAEPLSIAYTRTATVIGFVHFFTMLAALTIYASLVQINPRLLLAASDLGASPLQTFWRVTLPLSAAGVSVGAFLTFLITIGDYITPQILGGNTDIVLPQLILFQITRRGDIPFAAAISLVLMAVISIGYLAVAGRLRMRA